MKQVRELLAEGDVEAAAKLINYTSPDLDEYIKIENLKKDYEQHVYFLDLGDKITKDILKIIDNDTTRTSK